MDVTSTRGRSMLASGIRSTEIWTVWRTTGSAASGHDATRKLQHARPKSQSRLEGAPDAARSRIYRADSGILRLAVEQNQSNGNAANAYKQQEDMELEGEKQARNQGQMQPRQNLMQLSLLLGVHPSMLTQTSNSSTSGNPL